MTPRRKKTEPGAFPDLTCAACRFCLGQRDEWECWSQPPKLPEPEDVGVSRGRPTDPAHPACYFFIARANG